MIKVKTKKKMCSVCVLCANIGLEFITILCVCFAHIQKVYISVSLISGFKITCNLRPNGCKDKYSLCVTSIIKVCHICLDDMIRNLLVVF